MNGRTDNGTGTRPAGGRRGGAGRAWWWIPVAAIAIVVAVLLLRGGGEEQDGPEAVPRTPSLEPAQPGEAQTGSITIGGEDAAPMLEAGGLGDRAGEEVIGTLVPLDSVIADGVYWIGEGRAQMLLVEPEGQGRRLAEGDQLTFTGTLQPLDDEISAAVWGVEAERRLEEQGVYIEVDDLAVEPPDGP
jgi:hypothetical protein